MRQAQLKELRFQLREARKHLNRVLVLPIDYEETGAEAADRLESGCKKALHLIQEAMILAECSPLDWDLSEGITQRVSEEHA